MPYPEKSLERGIERVFEDMKPQHGDQFICCVRFEGACESFAAGTCSCKLITFDETTTVESIAAAYRSAMI